MPRRARVKSTKWSSKGGNRVRRLTAHERGYTQEWRRARKAFLDRYPLCVDCGGVGDLLRAMEPQRRQEILEQWLRTENIGLVVSATVVDHVIPHKGDHDLFWDESNWLPECSSCHSRKTATEDGGFGNQPRQ